MMDTTTAPARPASMAELSYSQLNVLLDCGEKFRLQYGHRLGLFSDPIPREPQGSFLGGIAIHETIEDAERDQAWWNRELFVDGGSMLERFHVRLAEAVERAHFPCPDCLGTGEGCTRCGGDGALQGAVAIRWGGRGGGENLTWWHKQGEFMLRRYQETRVRLHDLGMRVLPDGIEMKVTADLPTCRICSRRETVHAVVDGEHSFTPRRIVAYIDAFLALNAAEEEGAVEWVDRREGEILTGRPLVVDYKSGQISRASPFQPSTYGWMVEAGGPGFTVDDGLLIYLRAQDETRRLQWFDLRPLKPRVPETYDAIARMQETGLFIPNPNAWHDSCGVRHACSYYAALQAAKHPAEEEEG